MQPLKNYKKDFPWFENNKDWVFLDNAATTLKPKSMIDAINIYYEKYSANPHSNNKLAIQVSKQIEMTRKILAQYIHADIDEVMFTSGATESINTIANAMEDVLHPDDEIILTYMEHSANLLPWYKLRDRIGVKLIFVNKDGTIINSSEIKKHLTSKTKFVSFTAASNILADEVNVKEIIKIIKEFNKDILTLVDSTQYIEHFELNCHDLNVDFCVGSGHKMIGPTGTGFLYIKKSFFDVINPLKYGGDMNQEVYEDHFTFVKDNHKFEGGTPNAAGLFAWQESIKYLLNITNKEISNREILLKKHFLNNLPKRKDFILYTPNEKTPLITFNFIDKNKKIIKSEIIEKYFESKKILIRNSLSCAKLARYPLKVESVIRASILFYNDYEDIDALIKAINDFPCYE